MPKRGNYKKYIRDPSTPIPLTTKWRMEKSKKKYSEVQQKLNFTIDITHKVKDPFLIICFLTENKSEF